MVKLSSLLIFFLSLFLEFGFEGYTPLIVNMKK